MLLFSNFSWLMLNVCLLCCTALKKSQSEFLQVSTKRCFMKLFKTKSINDTADACMDAIGWYWMHSDFRMLCVPVAYCKRKKRKSLQKFLVKKKISRPISRVHQYSRTITCQYVNNVIRFGLCYLIIYTHFIFKLCK